jgi:hypothetical protein
MLSKCRNKEIRHSGQDKEIILISEKGGKVVYQYDKQMNLINIFTSAVDAEKHTNIKAGNIRQCCSGRSKTAGGFVWRYRKENEDL